MSIFHEIEIPRHSQIFKTSVIPLPIELEDNDNQEVIISKDNNVDMFAEVCMIPKSSSLFILSFNNLAYTVKPSSKMIIFRGSKLESHKILLNDISGIAREGEIMAILGASGAGKSTLLDALAGRITKHSLKGSVSLNGEDVLYKNSNILKKISAYVMQDDLFFPMLTVKETLMYSAEFRLPRTLSKSKKKARVNALIEQLGLQAAIDTIIGDEGLNLHVLSRFTCHYKINVMKKKTGYSKQGNCTVQQSEKNVDLLEETAGLNKVPSSFFSITLTLPLCMKSRGYTLSIYIYQTQISDKQ
ncbi:hypothetical protein ACFE04_016136 [Oxalis oulophora]